MQAFIEFVIKFKNYISFTALVVISLSLISMGNINQIGGFRTVVIGTLGWFQEAFSWFPNPTALRNENIALRELNLQLSNEVTKMREAVVENKALRSLLDFRQKAVQELEAVDIVGVSTIQMRSYFTINKGAKQGIYKGMTLRTDAGLVGIVIGSSKNYAFVESIMNRDIKISAKSLRSEYKGIVVWEGGEDLIMINVPKTHDVKAGDIIVTSEFSNKYPNNIPIGRVKEAKQEPGYLFLKVTIKPYVNFSTLEQAFVLKQTPNTELIELTEELDDILSARQKKPKKDDKIIFTPKGKNN